MAWAKPSTLSDEELDRRIDGYRSAVKPDLTQLQRLHDLVAERDVFRPARAKSEED